MSVHTRPSTTTAMRQKVEESISTTTTVVRPIRRPEREDDDDDDKDRLRRDAVGDGRMETDFSILASPSPLFGTKQNTQRLLLQFGQVLVTSFF